MMKFGRYQIVKEIGRGSMGVVYQARDPHIERLVAVKVLRQDRVTSEDFVRRFLKEARVIGRLSHSNIVAIYDVGEEDDMVYIAMELLDGVSLFDVIKGKKLNAIEIVTLGIQLAETLDYAHQKGVVHRDIKPSNIIVEENGQIKITDFGIAHVEDPNATLQTQAGEIMGTPSYMSPEQVLSKPVDGRTDIFSLGVILYEMTAGRRPFGGDGKALMTVMNEVVELTPQEPTGIPVGLSRAIMKALQKDPGKRFDTGKEFADALRVCLDDGGSTASRKLRQSDPSTSTPGRRVVIYLAAAVVASAVAFGCYFVVSAPPKMQPPLSQLPTTQLPTKESSKAQPPTTVISTTQQPKAQSPKPQSPKPQQLTTPLPVRNATLNVITSPPGANVYVNDVHKGTTPIVVTVNSGKHRIKLTREGYKDVERKVMLKEDSEYPLSEELTPVN